MAQIADAWEDTSNIAPQDQRHQESHCVDLLCKHIEWPSWRHNTCEKPSYFRLQFSTSRAFYKVGHSKSPPQTCSGLDYMAVTQTCKYFFFSIHSLGTSAATVISNKYAMFTQCITSIIHVLGNITSTYLTFLCWQDKAQCFQLEFHYVAQWYASSEENCMCIAPYLRNQFTKINMTVVTQILTDSI
jgi:hypothetical protein